MERNKAIASIENTFDNSFDKKQFVLFIQNLLNDIDMSHYREYRGNLIKEAFRDHISQYCRVGKYTDPNGIELDVLIVEVKDETKLDRARTSLRNFVINHLNTFEKEYALAAFYSKTDNGRNWRFSFIKLEHQTLVKEGKIKQLKELTPAKRYSFLVGEDEKCHTAKRQLLPLLQNVYNNPLIEDLEKAFSIEVVTDEFYEQYKGLFIHLSEAFSSDSQLADILTSSGLDIPRFTKKLLGQIVFLYFLQKKGWLGVPKDGNWGDGQKNFLQAMYKKADNEGNNFFRDYLQYLFYEALAHQHGKDNYYERFDCRIPFLNGGLFEADYNWSKANITLHNSLFRNQEKINKTGDIGTGVLDVFDRYNFTIREDEPLEKEVAVDPEMLGKVFENMLEITERKSKGAFYTPREIVHYMCQESLINYLYNSVNDNTSNLIPKEEIENFVYNGIFTVENDALISEKEHETDTYKYKLSKNIRVHADTLDRLITNIKICDPAIGSGAFPVGLLNELVGLQLVLKKHLSKDYLAEKLQIIGLAEEEYQTNVEKYTYRIKRHNIQESIYGVDIDASAIDIARLRLWLSLVVDEEDFDNIEALPNLDYKIVCGNSLIGMPKSTVRDLRIENELEKLKEDFFSEKDDALKKNLRNKINTKIRDLLDSVEAFCGYKIDFDFKLFFSEVWREKGGFDIVIGNPPYVGISKVEYKNTLKKIAYETYITTGDLYVLFYENGYKRLKEGGNINLITSNKWINASYGAKTRNFFAKRTNPKQLIDFSKVRIFPNATVFVNILMLERNKAGGKVEAVAIEGNNLPAISLRNYFLEKKVILTIKGEEVWKIGSSKELTINKTIEEKGTRLKNWKGIDFFRGITTGFNSAYHLKKEIRDELILENPQNKEYIFPLLRGKDIKRWNYKYTDWYMLFIPWHFPLHNNISISKASSEAEEIFIKEFPYLYKYLNKYKKELTERNKDETGIRYEWYALQRYGSNYWTEFLKEKIVWIEISDRANFAYDEKGYFLTNSAYFISGKNLKYIISILNSSVSDYYFFQITAKIAGGRKRYTKQYVEQIPIPLIGKKEQLPYEQLVDYVTFSKSKAKETIFSFFEALLDSIVFELYFPEEIHSANKGIIEYLHDLHPIDNTISDEEKLSIINSEFERLYDPYHPVRNNVDTIENVEVVRIIKEALKK